MITSCPNGPDVPLANINLKVSSSVTNRSGSQDGGYLDFKDLTFQYKAYPVNSWSVDPRGTVREWKTVLITEDGLFSIGSIMPTQWVIETRFLNKENKEVFYGKSEIDVSKDQAVDIELEAVEPVLEKLNGSIRIVINTDNNFSNLDNLDPDEKVVITKLSFKYRYNNTQDSNIRSKSNRRYELKYASNDKEITGAVDLLDSEDKVVGKITYEDESYIITLTDVPYGYYFYNIDYEYYVKEKIREEGAIYYEKKAYSSTEEDGDSYVYLDKESVEKEWNFNEGGIKPESSNTYVQYEADGILMDEVDLESTDVEGIVSPENHYYILPGTVTEMEGTIGINTHEIMLTADYNGEGADYEWTYTNVQDNKLRVLKGKTVTVDFFDGLSNSRRILDYDGKAVDLKITKGGETYTSKFYINVGYDGHIKTDENVEEFYTTAFEHDGEHKLVKVGEVVIDGKRTVLPRVDIDTESSLTSFPEIVDNFISGEKIKVYVNRGSEDYSVKEAGYDAVIDIFTTEGWHKEAEGLEVKDLTGNSLYGVDIKGESNNAFSFTVPNQSIYLDLKVSPNTAEITYRKGELKGSGHEYTSEEISMLPSTYKGITVDGEEYKQSLSWDGNRYIAPTLYRAVGYTQTGWESEEGKEWIEGESLSEILRAGEETSKVFTAKWKANRAILNFTYTRDGNLVNDKDGRSTSLVKGAVPVDINARTLVYDEEYHLPVLTADGYTFKGWKISQAGGEEFDKESLNENVDNVIRNDKEYQWFTEDGAELEATAQWEANEATLVYMTDPTGSSEVILPSSETLVYDKPYSLKTVSAEGYIFDGWKIMKGSSDYVNNANLNKLVKGEITSDADTQWFEEDNTKAPAGCVAIAMAHRCSGNYGSSERGI